MLEVSEGCGCACGCAYPNSLPSVTEEVVQEMDQDGWSVEVVKLLDEQVSLDGVEGGAEVHE